MIWRSSGKVGFGIFKKTVVALYCDYKGNVAGLFKCNVCQTGTGCNPQECPLPDAVCSSNDGLGNA